MQPAAKADEHAGGAEDVPDAVQQPAPAAQRPGVGQMGDRLLHQRAQPGLQAVVGPLLGLRRSMVRRSPTGACQCSRVLAMPRNPRSSRLATSTLSSTSPSPASLMSSCSWQLPGQPPSTHSRSPWMVETARPWAVWCGAWGRTGPSGWPSRGVVAPGWPARPPRSPRRLRPSRKASGAGRRGW
jgi:hypothetical protein